MSLAIAFKGPEGIVLAADSRVTLMAQNHQTNEVLQATYDNATKLLRIPGQTHVGTVVYGQAALGGTSPRTIHSYVPELEEELKDEGRLTVEKCATKLGVFFNDQWQQTMPPNTPGDVVFLVAGYNEGEPYGRVYEVKVPTQITPQEKNPGDDRFGLSWGGQGEITNRLLHGMEPRALGLIKDHLGLDAAATTALGEHVRQSMRLPIPYQFLPLQDCVDLSILLIRTTTDLLGFLVGKRGVGGAIDVAVVTRTEGFKPIKQKKIRGDDRLLPEG